MSCITTPFLVPKDLQTPSYPDVEGWFCFQTKKKQSKNQPSRAALAHQRIRPMVQIICLFLQRQDQTLLSVYSSLPVTKVLPMLRICLPELGLHHLVAQVKLLFS